MLRRLPASLVVLVVCLAQWTAMRPAWAWCPPANSVTISAPANGSKATFNTATPGSKSISCSAAADPLCNNPRIEWTCENVSGTQETWNPDPPKGASVTLSLTGLPSYNNQFGNTWVKARIPEDSVSDTNTFKLFFTKEATNHPGGGTPNRYYYWKQTSANYGTHEYWGYISETRWVGGAWVARIGPDACGTFTPEQGRNEGEELDGIDLFAYTCRHEAKHKADNNAWFPNGYNPSIDFDESQGDLLPDSLEPSLGGTQESPLNGGPFSPDYIDTDDDGRPDNEDYVMHTQTSWDVGSADSSDWANPGHQY